MVIPNEYVKYLRIAQESKQKRLRQERLLANKTGQWDSFKTELVRLAQFLKDNNFENREIIDALSVFADDNQASALLQVNATPIDDKSVKEIIIDTIKQLNQSEIIR